jgi:MFS family permease
MSEKHTDVCTEAIQPVEHQSDLHHGNIEKEAPMEHIAELQAARHIDLTWRSWVVVFISCFAIMAQVFVVIAAGSVIAFIIADLGDAPIAGWIISGPLLMQAVLSPFVGRLSDVLDRKLFAAVPPLIAFVGAIVCAKATSMSMLIGGGILIGTTLSTISTYINGQTGISNHVVATWSLTTIELTFAPDLCCLKHWLTLFEGIVQSIPSEVLPLKFRALANGFSFLGGAVGGLVGGLGAGGLTNRSPSGWV